jgi:hypothetical protein
MPRIEWVFVAGLVGMTACGRGGNDLDGTGGAGGTTAPRSGAACRLQPPCPSGWLEWTDSMCSPPYLGSGPTCGTNGDGLCYQPCTTASDCDDPLFPNCGSITVFAGSDQGQSKSVCVSVDVVPACPSSSDASAGTGGGGGSAGDGGLTCTQGQWVWMCGTGGTPSWSDRDCYMRCPLYTGAGGVGGSAVGGAAGSGVGGFGGGGGNLGAGAMWPAGGGGSAGAGGY